MPLVPPLAPALSCVRQCARRPLPPAPPSAPRRRPRCHACHRRLRRLQHAASAQPASVPHARGLHATVSKGFPIETYPALGGQGPTRGTVLRNTSGTSGTSLAAARPSSQGTRCRAAVLWYTARQSVATVRAAAQSDAVTSRANEDGGAGSEIAETAVLRRHRLQHGLCTKNVAGQHGRCME